jgi:hypothetical protein
MTAVRPIDNTRTNNHEFETVSLLVFPEQLFLAQFGVRVVIAALGMRFEHGLLVHLCATAEASNSVHTKRAHQDDAHRLAICHGIQQIPGSYYGIEKEVRGSSLLSSGEMKNKLHTLYGSSGILSMLKVSDAILKLGMGMFRQRL